MEKRLDFTPVQRQRLPDDLAERIRQEAARLDLVDRLDAVRQAAAGLADGGFDYAAADRGYAQAFEEAGIFVRGDDPAAVAARVRNSPLSRTKTACLTIYG